ncbi:MAG: toll/interleukin-1 receptor domain-containing protein [candidate division NC10 bacterium]|nr:toll/interleukin-1 receptor domain-containing protein [candidate division NC10 bacterium]
MIFLSYSSDHSFVADLLQFAYEAMLKDIDAKVWTYERDQARDEKAVAQNLKEKVKESKAVVFLVTPSTLDKGAAQWMELAYADAFEVPTFVLLHQLTYANLKSKQGRVPPLLLAAQCNSSNQWRKVAEDLRNLCQQH